MISHNYIRFASYLAIAAFCMSCSNKGNDIDDRGFAKEDSSTPKQRLELKSKLGYQSYANYVVTANVYKDNELHKECIVVKDDYCAKYLGYRYCSVWPGGEPNPQSLKDVILPASMTKTAQKFQYSEICDDELFNTQSLNNHLRLMQQFNHDLFESIVLTNNTLISNADVLTHGERESQYYSSASCYGKAKSAFIKDSDYEQASLNGYRYYIQLRGANPENGGFVIYEIEEKLSTYYALSGYDCRAIKGHKLNPNATVFKGYTYADLDKLMANRLTYCKSMCKSYDEEGKANGWATEPDSSVTPVSLDDVSTDPPTVFANADIRDNAPSAGNSPAANNAPVGDSVPTTNVQVPDLIPAPAVTNPPEERLVFKRSIKNKKGKREYLIFDDTQLNTPCYVPLLENQDVLTNTHYCIPYSGIDTQLKHPLDPTKTATTLENYKFCDNNISIAKRNIPGLAGFFKAFNPTYYASDLARFIDDPFQIHKSKRREGSKNDYTDYSYYLPDPYNTGFEACDGADILIPNPFITEEEYKKYNLKPGVVFLTASAAKGEKVLHQYWQIFTGIPQNVCECAWEITDGEGSGGCSMFDENIIWVRDLSSKDTYLELMPQLTVAMEARTRYCQAVNNTLINEARAGNWALIAADSPLLKKK